MTWLELLALLAAGAAAGLINTVVGSGTLITFPTLLALGVPPVVANVSNTVGLAPGSLSGALSMRPELSGQRDRIIRLGLASLIGGITGAVLLLVLPSAAFDAIVPILIGIGCLLVIVQPVLSRRLAARRARLGVGAAPAHGSLWLWTMVLLTGVYGGYFGAAQGVLLLAIMGIGLVEDLPRINALKNVLALIVNGIAGLIFVILPLTPWAQAGAAIYWPAAFAIAVGSVLGAQVGGRVGRRLPPTLYRVVIVCVGVAAIIGLVR
ncbi:MAG TPA: sulfite exporter TauE/SafE family protein [Propionibacteriaceae bacterium]|nr:sulfite exporter TauE/SafE family protein [Propionibacteriaceae bacterium]